MPVSLQHFLVYGLVLIVAIFFGRRLWCAMRGAGKCSRNCSCGKAEIKRDPVISNYLKRSESEKRESK